MRRNAHDLSRTAEVIEAQHRYAFGIDTRDWEMYRSVFADVVHFDFTSWYGGEPSEIPADDWVRRVAATQSGFDGTQHQMSNHRVVLDGGQAHCTTYIVARHYLRIDGEHHIEAIGGYYSNRLQHAGDRWLIDRCVLTVLWTKGDRKLFALAAERAKSTLPKSTK
jgi:hypothetical protein